MKLKKGIISLIFFLVIALGQMAFSQPMTPSQHGEEGDQPAPIGSGIAILLTLAGAYGAKKVYDARKKIRE